MPRPSTPTLTPYIEQLPDVDNPATWAELTPLFWNWVTGDGYDNIADIVTYGEGAIDFIEDQIDAVDAAALTATTQAGIATTQAGIATTQAGNAAASAAAAATFDPDNFLRVGPGIATPSLDFNAITTGGLYTLSGTYTNGPVSGAFTGTLQVIERGFTAGARVTQILSASGTEPTIWVRVGSGSSVVWSAWREFLTSNDISANADFTVDPTSLADRETIADYVVGRDLQGGTPVATVSGTAFDFTSIPAGVQEIDVIFDGTSLSGTDNFLVQLGTSGGVATSGYTSSSVSFDGSGGARVNSTSGFIVRGAIGNSDPILTIRLRRFAPGSNVWLCDYAGYRSAGPSVVTGGGRVGMAAEVDRVRVTRTGSNTFDAGWLNARWR
jgi:hypothetical protein